MHPLALCVSSLLFDAFYIYRYAALKAVLIKQNNFKDLITLCKDSFIFCGFPSEDTVPVGFSAKQRYAANGDF